MQSAIASEGTPDVSSLTVGKMQCATASEGTPERYHVQGPRPENFYKKDDEDKQKKNDGATKTKERRGGHSCHAFTNNGRMQSAVASEGTAAVPALTIGECNLLLLARALLIGLH